MVTTVWAICTTAVTMAALCGSSIARDKIQRAIDRRALESHTRCATVDPDVLLCAPRARALLGDHSRDFVVAAVVGVGGPAVIASVSPAAALWCVACVLVACAASVVGTVIRVAPGDRVVDGSTDTFLRAAIDDLALFRRLGAVPALQRRLTVVAHDAGTRGRRGEYGSALIGGVTDACAGAVLIGPMIVLHADSTVLAVAAAVAWSLTSASAAFGSAATAAVDHVRVCVHTSRSRRAPEQAQPVHILTVDDPAWQTGDTVRAVVTAGSSAADDTVWRALDDCGLGVPLRTLPLGLGTPSAAVRTRLGVEAASRLALARIVLAAPDVAVVAPQITLTRNDIDLLTNRRTAVRHTLEEIR